MKEGEVAELLSKLSGIERKYLLLIVVAVLTTALVAQWEKWTENFADEYDYTPQKVDYLENTFQTINASCYCMVCENQTDESWFFGLIDSPPLTLEGGKCYFRGLNDPNAGKDQQCDYEYAKKALSKKTLDDKDAEAAFDNINIRQFMLGQGPGFADFYKANSYSLNGLSMAVKWIPSVDTGNGNEYYPLPEVNRSTCMLRANVLPVYVLYSNSTAVSADRARKIAQQFKDKGPVILTTEMNFNYRDDAIVSEVQNQILGMKAECPNCLIAVAPPFNDTAALDLVLSDDQVNKSTDIVAIGIDSRLANTTFTECNYAWLIEQGKRYAQYALTTYRKPSIIAYFMIEENVPHDYSSCVWPEGSTAKANSFLFRTEFPVLLRNGIIGFAPYAYYDMFNPLRCDGCAPTNYNDALNYVEANPNPTGDTDGIDSAFLDYSDPDAAFDQPADYKAQPFKSEPRFSYWFGLADYYFKSGSMTPSIFPSQSENASGCSFGEKNQRFWMYLSDNSDLAKKLSSGSSESLITSYEVPAFKCDACVATEKEKPDLKLDFNKGANEKECSIYSPLDVFADRFDIDPLFLRAVVSHESAFHYCAASKVPRDAAAYKEVKGTDNGQLLVNDTGCFPVGLDQSKITNHQAELSEKMPQCSLWIENPDKVRYCAFGLTQTIEFPSVFWENGQNPHGLSSSEISSACFSDYNPFNVTHSACLGAYKLKKYVDSGKAVLSKTDNLKELGIANKDGEIKKPELINWYAYFFAAGMYRGGFNPQAFINEYASNKHGCDITVFKIVHDTDGTPYTIAEKQHQKADDLMEYVELCAKDNKGAVYGRWLLSKYYALTKECKESGCPPQNLPELISKP